MSNSNALSTSQTAAWRELSRRHPDDPHAWSMAHRVIGMEAPLHLPALAEIARDPHPLVVIQKSAQVGATELLVNLALWAADTGHAQRGHVLFLMPTDNQMSDFAQSRFDRAIQSSAYLRERLQPEPPRRKSADSRRLKQLGAGQIFLRGAESARQIASVDADLVILDEYDQMADGVLALAQKRTTSSRRPLLRIASTPRFPETGVNGLYLQSDQRRYVLSCPQCGLRQYLTWEANVDRERIAIVCGECRAPLDTRSKGEWVAHAPGNDRIHGYHLSRLYSPWLDLRQMIAASEATTPAALQEFQNSDLGETFVPPGGGLSLDALDRARCDYDLAEYAGQPCVMGVDVGLRFHVVIREDTLQQVVTDELITWGRQDRVSQLWFAGEVETWDDLVALRRRFNVGITVVDSQPEVHAAREFAARDHESIWLARYLPSATEVVCEYYPVRTVQIDRLIALDATFQRFREGEVLLPCAARSLGGHVRDGIGEYYREMTALRRTLEQDSNGNWRARWVDGSRPDHYAHAELYCWLADQLGYREHGFVFLPRIPTR